MNKTLLLTLLFVAINSITLDLEAVRSDMLTKHNYYRAQHQVSDLSRVSAIESIAQNYSDYLASINTMVHSSNQYLGTKLGENLYWGPKNANIGKSSVDAWYNEVDDYDFNSPGFSGSTGHFTQVVWKGSQNLGCGVGCGTKNYCYVTCNYYPPGNYLGQFGSNVFPKVTDPDNTASDTTTPETTAPETTSPETTAPETTAPETTAPDTTATNTNPALETFREQITARHNYYRAQHQVGNLQRDSELERIAQAAAEHMIEIDNFYFTTETYNGNYIGKNLFWTWGSTPNGSSQADSWYNGVSSYNFDNPGYTSGAGSFTQMVWKNSQKIGCGYSCSGSQCYGCCTYYPAGNYLNSFAANVFPKTS